MSVELFKTFVEAARSVADTDKQEAVAHIQSALCCRDVPEGYKRDAREIMTLLLIDCFKTPSI